MTNNKNTAQENIIGRTSLHWVIFSFPALWLVLFFIMYNFGSAIPIEAIYKLTLLILLIFAMVDSIRTWIRYKTTEFTLTNKRLVIKQGLLRRDTSEFFLGKIENLQIEQTILGKLLGYGALIIRGTGGTQAAFFQMADPVAFCAKVQEQVEKIESEL